MASTPTPSSQLEREAKADRLQFDHVDIIIVVGGFVSITAHPSNNRIGPGSADSRNESCRVANSSVRSQKPPFRDAGPVEVFPLAGAAGEREAGLRADLS